MEEPVYTTSDESNDDDTGADETYEPGPELDEDDEEVIEMGVAGDAPKSKRRKKPKPPAIKLGRGDWAYAVEFIKAHPILFDQTKMDFKNNDKKDKLWEELGADLNRSLDEMKRWYRTQRTTYSKKVVPGGKSGKKHLLLVL